MYASSHIARFWLEVVLLKQEAFAGYRVTCMREREITMLLPANKSDRICQ